MERLRSYEVKDTIRRVTRTEPEVFDAYGEETHLVAVMDYGVKQNIIECLRRRGCKVVALPAYTPASEVLSSGFDGVMLSNGPGDPAENTEIIAEPAFLSSCSPISSEVQSAVRPLVSAEETRGPRSRPITVAPIRQICGFSSLNRLISTEEWGSEV